MCFFFLRYSCFICRDNQSFRMAGTTRWSEMERRGQSGPRDQVEAIASCLPFTSCLLSWAATFLALSSLSLHPQLHLPRARIPSKMHPALLFWKGSSCLVRVLPSRTAPTHQRYLGSWVPTPQYGGPWPARRYVPGTLYLLPRCSPLQAPRPTKIPGPTRTPRSGLAHCPPANPGARLSLLGFFVPLPPLTPRPVGPVQPTRVQTGGDVALCLLLQVLYQGIPLST